ncbi:hypothetical protein Celaphus_00009539 [Cervus elaphus hippelaphus]|uniref:Uncharacterized protein n=1 Tax=Cervus elaphus hippelaphus TaxID=46360 RepID=A0A212C087_CEREH|nr:hypothetical protein Celaphus_00009539 [Cervus elaphus hippelaphus]
MPAPSGSSSETQSSEFSRLWWRFQCWHTGSSCSHLRLELWPGGWRAFGQVDEDMSTGKVQQHAAHRRSLGMQSERSNFDAFAQQ